MKDESVTRMLPLGGDDGSGGGDAPAEIVVLAGVARGQVLGLHDQTVSIGRRSDNDLVLESPSVSKYHARILCRGGSYLVEDLGSTNGVRVNGSPLSKRGQRSLSHGDNVMVSDQLLMFRLAGTFTDTEGLSTISFDPGKVKEEVDQLLGDLPGLTNVARERRASRGRASKPTTRRPQDRDRPR